MISVYETIGKPIVNPKTNAILGIILNANFKGTKLSGFSFFNGNEDEFYLPVSNILNITDAVILKTEKYIKELDEETTNYLGHTIYSKQGEFLAYISDILVDDKLFTISKILSEKKEPLNIAVLPKIKRAPYVKKVTLHQPKKVKPENIQSPLGLPNKVISNYRFLIGRTTAHPVYNKDGELLIDAHTSLDEEAIIKIWQHDRIWDIMK